MITRSLPCKLNDEELKERGKGVGELGSRRSQLELQKKESTADYNHKIARLDAEIDALHKQLRTGEEYRPVEITDSKDFERKCVTTTRKDTGEVVDERPLTAAELQLEIESKPPLPDVRDPS